MDEAAAGAVLLVRAIEDADARGEVLSPADRRWATREAAPPQPGEHDGAAALTAAEASFLERRARRLLHGLERRYPFLARTRAAAEWHGWTAIALGIASFALGIASNALGGQRHVNILAFPLLGMLIWNIAVYGLLLARAVHGRAGRVAGAANGGPWRHAVRAVLVRSGAAAFDAGLPAALAAGVRAHAAQWSALASALHGARIARLLHLCAALLAAGAVAGLYLRGIAFEYRAGWESTFLNAQSVQALLAAVLGPASAVTGIPLPDAAGVEALQWSGSGSGENAARWIHLYAATALLFIGLPRIALALHAASAERRLSRDFPLPADLPRYCRSLLAARHSHDGVARAAVVAVHRTLSERELAMLGERLEEATGMRVAAELRAAVRYGEEDEHVAALAASEPSGCTVLVFDLGATPEGENHGLLLQAYRTAATPSAPLIAVIDEAGYRRRLAGQAGAQARLAERRAAWSQFALEHGVEIVPLDLEPAGAPTARP